MKIKIKNKSKAQVSIEYILIFSAILSLSIAYFTTLNTIYNKNLEKLDQRNLIENTKQLQNIVDFLELQPKGQQTLIINSIDCWSFKIINNKLIIKNKLQEKEIIFPRKIDTNIKEICKSQEIQIIKENEMYKIVKLN